MNEFDFITQKAVGYTFPRKSDGDSNSNRSSFSGAGLGFGNQLQNMPEGALEKVLFSLQMQLQSARTETQRLKVQEQISMVEAELVKRKQESGKPVVVQDIASEQNMRSTGVMAKNVGTGAFLFGVIGFMVGAYQNKGWNNTLAWGGGGLVLGAGLSWLATKYGK